MIAPYRGFAPAVRRQIKGELGFTSADGLEVRWTLVREGHFFDIDRANSKLVLNQRYRYLFASSGGTLNDAPLVKALMFLLMHDVFEGAHLGPKDKDNIALWRSILGAAVKAEDEMRGE